MTIGSFGMTIGSCRPTCASSRPTIGSYGETLGSSQPTIDDVAADDRHVRGHDLDKFERGRLRALHDLEKGLEEEEA